MTDLVFAILDELYFISTFQELCEKTSIDESLLKLELWNLIEKEWIKCLENEQEMTVSLAEYDSNFKNYHYIASKKGLFAHNTLS